MPQQSVRCLWIHALVAGATFGGLTSYPPARAQIVPDATLGNTPSMRSPVMSDRGLIDRIDGGALRGTNLFHSFSDFNVNTGQQVYFANPANIRNIISRVTGQNLSNIDGTLGVLGTANLFLINPNGIVFGANARLDIRGSFVGSTANQVAFSNGDVFSATNPNEPALLTVNAPLGLASWLPNAGTITNAANLSTGQDLSLVGANLNLRGQIAGAGSVNLIATNALTARDSIAQPLILSAGNQLLVQGNQSVDLVALSHPNSGLFAGGDMVLRSANEIAGDAHYTAGGSFRIETLTGQSGSLFSPADPIIRASGDVTFNDYTGASLHILAGGSVTIPGTITITGVEATDFLAETITLSNGSTVIINGNTQPTVDIRAGTTAFGTAGITGSAAGFTPIPATGGTGTSANIAIGNIINPSGLVFLTNQYQPNPTLSGDIAVGAINIAADPVAGLSGGSVAIDARGRLTFTTINVSGGALQPQPGFTAPDFSTLNITGNSGDVTLLARGELFMPLGSAIYAYGLTGGAITLSSDTAITQQNGPFGTDPFALSWIESDSLLTGRGGDVRLSAPLLSIGGNIFSTTEGDGRGGDLILTTRSLVTDQATILSQTFGAGATGDVTVNANNSISVGVFSTLGSANRGVGGNAGNVTVQTRSLALTDGGQISSSIFGTGNGGNITVVAQDIAISGFVPGALAVPFAGAGFAPSAIISSSLPGAQGNGGNITITTGTLTLTNAGAVSSSAQGVGNAGDTTINATQTVRVEGTAFTDFTTPPELRASAISSELLTGAIGQGGNITITTPVLAVTNGGAISASTGGSGDAGSITINATQSALFDGVATFGNTNAFDRISRAQVFAGETAIGNAGVLTITTPSLSLTNGGQITAQTNGVGNGGNLRVNVSNTLLIDGTSSAILANTTAGSSGNGGSIWIDPQRVFIQNGGQIAVNSQGSGVAGNIFLQAENLVLRNRGLITAETTSNTGGDITLQVSDVIAMRRNSRISTSAGTAGAGGDGGNIAINTRFLVAAPAENSDITANAFTGRGGNVNITAEGIFGFRILSRAELQTALGTTDPARLDPIFLPTSDITAISQVNPNLNGTIVIQSPDADPLRGVLPEPPEVVDASRLIARDCSASGAIARKLGSLVVTGQGGLPPSPTDQLRGDALLIGWEPLQRPAATGKPAAIAPTPRSPVQLVEVQTLEKRADGRVVLAAKAATNPEFWSRPTTCPDVPVSP